MEDAHDETFMRDTAMKRRTTYIADDVPDPSVLDLLHRAHDLDSFHKSGGVSSHVAYPYNDLEIRRSITPLCSYSKGNWPYIVSFLCTYDTFRAPDSQSHGLFDEDMFACIGGLSSHASLSHRQLHAVKEA